MNTIHKAILYSNHGVMHECPSWSLDDFIVNDETPIYAAVAYKFNNDLKNGYYVEIGANHFKNNNNTYYLEKEHGWTGISVEISKYYADLFNENRKNKCINDNAFRVNWEKYFEENNFPSTIDFLSIDIDSDAGIHANTMALLNLPLSRYKFNVIVIEHNGGVQYKFESAKKMQREVLSMFGYHLVYRGNCDDVWVRNEPSSMNGFDQIHNILRKSE